jgi:hypothetical protein
MCKCNYTWDLNVIYGSIDMQDTQQPLNPFKFVLNNSNIVSLEEIKVFEFK